MLKALTLLVTLCAMTMFTHARYTRSTMQQAMEDYAAAFKASDYELVEDPISDERLETVLTEEAHPIVGQEEDSWEGYYVDKVAFSRTDSFQYALQFKIGAQLDDNYDYVDECFDAWVELFDDIPYFQNNVTYRGQMIKNGTAGDWWLTYLNFTGILFNPISNIIVDCYQFGNSVAQYEIQRFTEFNQDWGEFFLAFLFNQMGNALTFQNKFVLINYYEGKQNYQSIWLEYGDLLHLIWDFAPLTDSTTAGSYDSIVDEINAYAADQSLFQEDTQMHKMIREAGIPAVAALIEDAAKGFSAVMTRVQAHVETLIAMIPEPKTPREERLKRKASSVNRGEVETPFIADTKLVNIFDHPWEIPTFTASEHTTDLLYGIANGAIDVFPFTSNPNRCRNNITQSWQAALNWHNWDYDIVNDQDDRLTFFKEISYFVGLPFGVSYSCYWGFATILINYDPMADGVLTEDERLEKMITLGHDIPTNLFYNIGYMYGDIFSLYDMSITTQNYWEKFGRYCGDFLIRIFWRRKFLRNFSYGDDDEDE